MKTDITVFHLTYDEEQNEKYVATYYSNVSWQGGIGASLNKGFIEANDVEIRIFHKDNNGLNDKQFFVGDIVARGRITKEIKTKSELDEAFNVTTIIPHKRGSLATNHIYIGAK